MTQKQKWISVFSLAALVLGLTWIDSAEARRRRRSRRAPRPKVVNEKKLIERIGGVVVLEKAVQSWTTELTTNPQLRELIPGISSLESDAQFKNQLRKDLTAEFCELADGPCTAPGKDDGPWRSLKAKWSLDEPRALALISVLSESMAAVEIAERERNELIGRLGDGDALSVADEVGPDSERRGGRR